MILRFYCRDGDKRFLNAWLIKKGIELYICIIDILEILPNIYRYELIIKDNNKGFTKERDKLVKSMKQSKNEA